MEKFKAMRLLLVANCIGFGLPLGDEATANVANFRQPSGDFL